MNPEEEVRKAQVVSLRKFADDIDAAHDCQQPVVIQGLATHMRQAANEIESLGCIPSDDADPSTLRALEDVAREKVIKIALMSASDHFDQDAADPGWQGEAHEDMLRDAVTEYRDAILARRSYGS